MRGGLTLLAMMLALAAPAEASPSLPFDAAELRAHCARQHATAPAAAALCLDTHTEAHARYAARWAPVPDRRLEPAWLTCEVEFVPRWHLVDDCARANEAALLRMEQAFQRHPDARDGVWGHCHGAHGFDYVAVHRCAQAALGGWRAPIVNDAYTDRPLRRWVPTD